MILIHVGKSARRAYLSGMTRSTLLCTILLCTCAVIATAQKEPHRKLLFQRIVAPGVVHKQMLLPGPNMVNVLEVDLSNPSVVFETTRPDGLVRTTTQGSTIDRDGHRVAGSINADFFSFETKLPIGNQVVNGVFAHGIRSACSHLAITGTRRPFIERLAFIGTIRTTDGCIDTIVQINNDRTAGTLAFYTHFRGRNTRTDSSGAECTLLLLNPPRAGDTLRAVIKEMGRGNMSIPTTGGTLSASAGPHAMFLASHIHPGDTLSLYLGFDAPLANVQQTLGGRGRFLAGGRNVTDSTSLLEGITAKFTGVRHPRTFVGFNADTTVMYLCTVDGRQRSSIGMTFADMAAFMRSLGATEAFNFDGGGSTTMVVRGEIVNSPSDAAGERPVANALHVISTAPDAALHFLPATQNLREPFSGVPDSTK
jgi:hypothetical protein